MLILPTDPQFLDSTIHFVQSFVPTLVLHRVHIQTRTESKLDLQLEMTDGSLMCLTANYWSDRIHLVLEYGWQTVELWMFANFPTELDGPQPSALPLKQTANLSLIDTYKDTIKDASNNRPSDDHSTSHPSQGSDQVPVNGIFSEHIDKERFELGRQSSLSDRPFGDLLSNFHLSGMKVEQALPSSNTNVTEERLFVLNRNVGKNRTFKEHLPPEGHTAFQQSITGPSTSNGEFEQSF